MPGYNFTDDVRRGLQAAREEAARLRHDEVQPVHILLGLLRQPGTHCTAALKQVGVESSALFQIAATAAPPPLADPPGGPDFAYSRAAKRVLELSMEEARGLRHGYVGPEHLLLGVLRQDDNLANLLAVSGLTADGFRSAVRELGPSERHGALESGSSFYSLHASPRAIPWLWFLLLSSRLVGWLALVIAVVALILAIRAQP